MCDHGLGEADKHIVLYFRPVAWEASASFALMALMSFWLFCSAYSFTIHCTLESATNLGKGNNTRIVELFYSCLDLGEADSTQTQRQRQANTSRFVTRTVSHPDLDA